MVTKKRGFVLLLTAMMMMALVGVLGLGLDLGQLYLVKGAAQTYTDVTALAAAKDLDGSPDGIERARARVKKSSFRWNARERAFQGGDVEFSPDGKIWMAEPQKPTGILYVRVSAMLREIQLLFLPAVTQHRTARVFTRSVAAQLAPEGDGEVRLVQ